MRLRSSQLVFLLLIACSVQVREEHALRWFEQAISGNSVRTFAQRESPVPAEQPNLSSDARLLAPLGLVPGALAAQREPWAMRRPALDSAAVTAYTGLLRV